MRQIYLFPLVESELMGASPSTRHPQYPMPLTYPHTRTDSQDYFSTVAQEVLVHHDLGIAHSIDWGPP